MKKITLLALVLFSVFSTILKSQTRPRSEFTSNSIQEKHRLRIQQKGINLPQNKSYNYRTAVTDTILAMDFTGVLNWGFPDNWLKIDKNNDMFVYNEQIMMTKTDSLLFLISPKIDLSNATFLEFTYGQGGPENQLSIGIMTDPEDATTFKRLDSVNVAWEWDTFHVMLENELNGEGHIAFHSTGESYYWLDDILVTSDAPELNYPERVTNLSVTPAAEGELKATIKWTNPSKEKDGDDLTTLDKVTVYVNGFIELEIENPTVGATIEEVMEIDSAWSYSFNVIAENSAGESKDVMVNSWIGLDIPAAPENLKLEVVESKPKVTWTAPTKGANGQYFEGTIESYIITCSSGFKDTVTGIQLEYIDETLEDPGVYNYSVAAVNSTGKGHAGSSNAMPLALGDYLYYDDFYINPLETGWNIDTAKANWSYNSYGGGIMDFNYAPDFEGTSRLISPKINSSGMTVLGLTFDNSHLPYPGPYTFKVETTSDGGTTWNEIFSKVHTEMTSTLTENIIFYNEDVGSEELQIAFTYEGNTLDLYRMSIYNFIVEEIEGVDISMISIETPNVVAVGETVEVTATARNIGSLDSPLKLTVDFVESGFSMVSSTVEINNILIGKDTTITFPAWETTKGNYDVLVYASAEEDINPSNDTIKSTLQVIPGVKRNYVIIEDGTGTWCGFCPGAAMGIDDLKKNGFPVAGIAYHSGDSYEINDGKSRLSYYGVSAFPTILFDGVYREEGGSGSESMYEDYVPLVEERLATITPITVNIEDYTLVDNKVTANVVIGRLTETVSEDLYLHATVVESHIPEVWMGQVELNDVMRAMYPDADGTKIDLLTDATKTVEVTFTINEGWIPEFMELIVFVQDVKTQEIFNADLHHIKEIENKANVTISVIDSDGELVANVNVDLDGESKTTDATGKVVFEEVDPGVHTYHVKSENHLPLYPVDFVIGFDDVEITEQLLPGEIIFREEFDSLYTIPEGWHISDHSENWIVGANQSDAGGEAPEALMWYNPQFDGKSALVSPKIALKEYTDENTELNLMFKYSVNDYSAQGGYALRARMISGEDTTQYWETTPRDNVLGTQNSFEMNNSDISADSVYFEFEFEGNNLNINWWTIDDIWIVKMQKVGVNEYYSSKANLYVYPNPAKDKITIQCEQHSSLKIYTMEGKCIYTISSTSTMNTINTNSFNDGMYIIMVSNGNSNVTTKFNVIK